MSPSLLDVESGLEAKQNNPGAIRSRLPAGIPSPAKRAVICAIRNPDATIEEVVTTTGTERESLLNGLAGVAEDRYPLDTTDSPVREAIFEAFLQMDIDPVTADPGEDTIETVAKTAGRLANSPVNANFVSNVLDRDGAANQFDALRTDRVVTDQKETAHGLAMLIGEIGLRRVVEALGENPPDDNLDRLMAAQDTVPGAEHGITTDYLRAQDNWTADDISKGTTYWAKINNKEGYGFFVTLAGHGRDDISGLVHRNNIPSMLSVGDFRTGDEVLVRLDEHKPNGDLAFKLAGVVDALNIPTQEFATADQPTDGDGQTVGTVAGVDEDELLEQAQTADDGPEGEPTESGTIQPNTSHHEVLYAIANMAAVASNAVTSKEIRTHFEGEINPGTVNGALTDNYNRRLVGRVEVDDPDHDYGYYLLDAGEEILDELGPPSRLADDDEDGLAMEDEFEPEMEEEIDVEHETEAEIETEPEMETSPTDEPMSTDTDSTDDEPQPRPDADFTGDVQMMAGMAIGRGDLTAEEAAASLRQVADRLESGGPGGWA